MRIEEAIPYLRAGGVVRCKRRYYAMISDVLYRVFIPAGSKEAKVLGLASIGGRDFMTEQWSETRLEVDRDGYE